MAMRELQGGGILYRRKIQKVVGGAKIDWNSGPVLKKIETTIAKMNALAALKTKRKAMRLVPYASGDLHDSIEAYPSKYTDAGFFFRHYKAIKVDWIVSAGSNEIDYAAKVELGWGKFKKGYKKGSKEGWLYGAQARPFMRPAAAYARKWLRRRMKDAIRRALT